MPIKRYLKSSYPFGYVIKLEVVVLTQIKFDENYMVTQNCLLLSSDFHRHFPRYHFDIHRAPTQAIILLQHYVNSNVISLRIPHTAWRKDKN